MYGIGTDVGLRTIVYLQKVLNIPKLPNIQNILIFVKMDQTATEFSDLLKEVTGVVGMDPVIGAIFGVLYLEPTEISMEDLAKKTGYSPASISSKTQMLEATGHIKRIKHPKSKKVFLYAEKDMIKMFRDSLMKRQDKKVHLIKTRLPPIIDRGKRVAKTPRDKVRVKIMENYYVQIIKLDKALDKFREALEKL